MNLSKISALLIILSWTSFSFAQDASAPPPVTASKAFKLTGYSQILGTVQESGQDSMSVRRIRFTLSAEIIKNLKAKVTVDAVKTPILIDAQFDFAFSKHLGLRFGQFYVPCGVESTTSTSDLDFINQSLAVEKLAPGRDTSAQGRDIGAILTGSYSIFNYNFGLFNGPGANKAETNDQKDFAGRFGIKPFEFLSLGASYYKGRLSAAAGAPAVRRDKSGIDAAVFIGSVSLKGEYLWAVDDQTHKSGWFAQAGWFVLPKKLQILVKLDAFDKNTDAAEDRVDLFTAGLNWFFSDKVKIQVNYEYAGNELSQTVNKAFLVQFQAGF